jgi:hypothetical protein
MNFFTKYLFPFIYLKLAFFHIICLEITSFYLNYNKYFYEKKKSKLCLYTIIYAY